MTDIAKTKTLYCQINPTLHRLLRIRAAMYEQTIPEVVACALEAYLRAPMEEEEMVEPTEPTPPKKATVPKAPTPPKASRKSMVTVATVTRASLSPTVSTIPTPAKKPRQPPATTGPGSPGWVPPVKAAPVAVTDDEFDPHAEFPPYDPAVDGDFDDLGDD